MISLSKRGHFWELHIKNVVTESQIGTHDYLTMSNSLSMGVSTHHNLTTNL